MGATTLGSGGLHSFVFVAIVSPPVLIFLCGLVGPQLPARVTVPKVASEPRNEVDGTGKLQGIL